MKMDEKQAIVAAVHEQAVSALSAVIADYRGLTVAAIAELRKRSREQGVYLRVVRNTLARRAVEGTEFECLQDSLVGPTVLAFSKTDPGAAARVIKEFAKTNEKLVVKALSVGGRLYGPQDIDVLATLPTRDQALATLMSLMLAPVTKLARTLNEIPGKLVRTVDAVREQKEAA